MNQSTLPLNAKVALITGSARRIGAEIARTLHAAGACVIIHYSTSVSAAERLIGELNAIRPGSCLGYQADLSNVESLRNMISEVLLLTGGLDILVNNASSFHPTPLGSITEQDWNQLFDSNVKGPLFLSQAAAPYLKNRKGCIINMVDIHADRPLAKHSVYCAAKAGLVMLTQSLALELGPEVRVNAVAPGIIIWPEVGANEAVQQDLVSRTALKREGVPAEIAQTVLFLVQSATYITGQVITVDGGRTLNQ